ATGAAKLDWSTFAPTGILWAPFAVADTVDLHVGGTVALNAFGVLLATGSVSFDEGQVTDVATVGTDAQALSLEIDAALFVGTGASLSGPTIETTGATGFSGSAASVKVVAIGQGARSWLGVQAAGLDLQALGIP